VWLRDDAVGVCSALFIDLLHAEGPDDLTRVRSFGQRYRKSRSFDKATASWFRQCSAGSSCVWPIIVAWIDISVPLSLDVELQKIVVQWAAAEIFDLGEGEEP
jgi:hypothetical protein